ncbi:MAG: hypothetical protein JST85_28950 [Acidobacteria bacterium]|nr:hypothetical protein [Acidobacteriota bacterium]
MDDFIEVFSKVILWEGSWREQAKASQSGKRPTNLMFCQISGCKASLRLGPFVAIDEMGFGVFVALVATAYSN